MADIIQLRRDVAADWTSVNPTLASGELGFETDTGKFKVGDGATAWTSLTYYTGSIDLDDLANVTITANASGEILKWNGSAWINNTLAEAGIQPAPSEGAFVDGDKTKLDGIEAGADVTDTTNVTAAGALMDSELTNITAVKALDQGVATSDSPQFAGVNVGHASDTTITRTGAGVIAVEGVEVTTNTATQTLTNKTLTAPAISSPTMTGTILEDVYALSGTTPALDPDNGSIQTWTLSGNSTPTDSLSAGESITLMVNDGTAYTITWPTMTWVNNAGAAPTLATSGYTVVVLWKVSTTLYGALVGDGT